MKPGSLSIRAEPRGTAGSIARHDNSDSAIKIACEDGDCPMAATMPLRRYFTTYILSVHSSFLGGMPAVMKAMLLP